MPIRKVKSDLLVMVIVFIAVITGCKISSPCNETLVERVKSPDGKVDAVLVKKDCGATISESFNIFIVGNGKKSEKKDLVFEADHMEEFSLSWRAPKFLEVKYRQARIFQFVNFWQSKYVDNFAYVVEIRETPLSQSHALSASDRWEE